MSTFLLGSFTVNSLSLFDPVLINHYYSSSASSRSSGERIVDETRGDKGVVLLEKVFYKPTKAYLYFCYHKKPSCNRSKGKRFLKKRSILHPRQTSFPSPPACWPPNRWANLASFLAVLHHHHHHHAIVSHSLTDIQGSRVQDAKQARKRNIITFPATAYFSDITYIFCTDKDRIFDPHPVPFPYHTSATSCHHHLMFVDISLAMLLHALDILIFRRSSERHT